MWFSDIVNTTVRFGAVIYVEDLELAVFQLSSMFM